VKHCVIVPDGAADLPLAALGGRTPLQAARTPHMDAMARGGQVGLTSHVPAGMTPGSAVAMMSLLGYDPARHFTGRAPLEAADLGIELGPRDWAVRCNLVTAADGALASSNAGHIATAEAARLIDALNGALGRDGRRFHVGTGYRHLLVGADLCGEGVRTVPPHDIVGLPLADSQPSGEGSGLLLDLMERSRAVLEDHEVNRARRAAGRRPANMIWLWGQGRRPALADFRSRFGPCGAVISAVNLVRGLGRLVGWEVVDVPGATGYTDTNYAAKGAHAVRALADHGLVLVHVEAPDEASHDRDPEAKVAAIERVDADVVGPVMAAPGLRGALRMMVVPDHVTSVEDGRHKRGAVPFAIWGAGVAASAAGGFSEAEAAGGVELPAGHELMGRFVGQGG
jgi:2,3-bisphosphoglycerate-independent phosphoglycerate mutase